MSELYIRQTPENNEWLIKEHKEEQAMLNNLLKKKLKERVQSDEQTRLNKYSEGFCYGCAKIDQVLSTLIWVCERCRHKRGVEGLMAIQTKKYMEELCDVCGRWQFSCWQINVSLCMRDQKRVHQIHREYRKNGKRMGSPYAKKQQRSLGKDWLLYHIPARNINKEFWRK